MALAVAGLLLVLAVAVAGPASGAGAGIACNRWASVSGNDSNPGTKASPVRSIPELVSILTAGQTGCLKGGELFDEPLGTAIVSSSNGTPAAPVVITSSGPAARVRAAIWIKDSADNITFRGIDFVGAPGPPKGTMIHIDGDGITLQSNNITYPAGICVDAGTTDISVPNDVGRVARNLKIVANRIHGCGVTAPLTHADSGVHGVYLVQTTDAVISDNYIYDNVNRGIQLYPRAKHTLVTHNVLDGNGSNLNIGSEAATGYLSSQSEIRANIITNSVLRSLVDPNFPGGDTAQIHGNYPINTPDDAYGNVVIGNCIWPAYGGETEPTKNFDGFGYSHSGNVFKDPLYVNRAAKDFRLRPGSPCAAMAPRLSTSAQPSAGVSSFIRPR